MAKGIVAELSNAVSELIGQWCVLELFSVRSFDLKIMFISGNCQTACILTLPVCLNKHSIENYASVANPT